MKKLFTISALFICIVTNSQNFVWAKSIGGTTNDQGRVISIDNAGNVITAGLFTGTADFDPGPGTYTMTSAGAEDIYMCKLTAAGAFVWAVRFGNNTGSFPGTGEKIGDIITDASNNIYAIGTFSSTVDFNPGAGTNTLTSIGAYDVFVTKFDANGSYLWAKQIGSTSSDMGNGIDIDNTGIYMTGYTSTGADFNPSATTNTVTNGGGVDIFVCKWDLNGNYLWAQGMGGTYIDAGYGIKVNPANNYVYTTGHFGGTADLSPGTSGPPTVTSAGNDDIFISALNATSGAYVNQAAMGGTGNDYGLSINVDASGNIYTTGSFTLSCDFDPGIAPVFLNSSGGTDAFVSKLTPGLTYLWAKQLDSPGTDEGESLVLDAYGNIYSTGFFNGVTDFDPSASTYTISATGQDAFVWKLSPSGNLVWAKSWGSSSSVIGNCICLDAIANVYTTGYYNSTCDFDPGVGTYSITTAGGLDSYVSKLSCTLPQTVTTNAPLTLSLCIGTSTSIPSTMTSAPEANVSYYWSVVGATGVNLSQTTGTTSTVSFTSSTSFSVVVTATNTCGTTTTTVSDITVNPLPTLSINIVPSATVCSGDVTTFNASGANTYTWNPSSITNGSSSAMYTGGVFTVTATDANSCINTKTVNFVVNPLPIITFVMSNTSICTGNTATITASGASSYSWWGGPSTASYVVSAGGNYTVTGTDINNCSHWAMTNNLTVYPLPNISTNPTNIYMCSGNTATFTASGATTYTWTGGPTNAVLTSTVAGIHTVSGTDNNGCINSTTVNLNVTQTPTVMATQSQSLVCNLGTVTFSASGAATYNWSNGITNGTPHAFSNLGSTPSTQTVSVRGWNGGGTCPDSTIVLTVTVMPVPLITITGKTLTCSGATNILTGHGGATYTWTPGSVISPTFAANATTPTVYSVSAHDAYGCFGDTTFTYNLILPQTPDICEVTVDSLSQFNNIMWDKTAYTNVDSFIVYREVSTNVYRRIGAQDENALSLFVDTARSVGPANGDPNITSYRYKLQIRDTCGNYSAKSPYHNTIYFITNTTGTFFWNTYNIEFQGSTPVSTFELVRDNNATGTWTVVGTSAGTSTSLNDPAFSSYPNAIYRVLANGFNCNPTAKTTQQINKTKSNVKNNFNTGGIPTGINVNTLNTAVSLAPNPATSQLIISFNTPVISTTKIIVTDVLGKVVYNSEIQEGTSIVIPVNEFTNGVYFVKVEQGKNYTVKKFIKE